MKIVDVGGTSLIGSRPRDPVQARRGRSLDEWLRRSQPAA